MKRLFYFFTMLVWATAALAEDPKELVLAELDMEPLGQVFVFRALKREMDFRAPIALNSSTADSPDMGHRGSFFELHRFSKRTGELRVLGGIPFVGERLDQFNRRAQLESDGIRVWMCVTDAPQDMCLIFEMPVNGPTNPVDSYYSEAEMAKQHKAGTHTRLSIDMLAPPGRHPSYRGIGNAKMKLVDGKLSFSGIATMGGTLDFKYDPVTKEWSGPTIEVAKREEAEWKAKHENEAMSVTPQDKSVSPQTKTATSQSVLASPQKKTPEAKPYPTTPTEEPPLFTPWNIIVVFIVAACFLLWLLFKRRS